MLTYADRKVGQQISLFIILCSLPFGVFFPKIEVPQNHPFQSVFGDSPFMETPHLRFFGRSRIFLIDPYPYMLHVCNIYQHLPEQNHPNVGKYTIHGAYGIPISLVALW